MGQQQLLLVILVVIVVGVATIVATNVISVGSQQANRDAVRQDLMTAASTVQHIWERAYMLGGAGQDFVNNSSDARLTDLIEITGERSGTTIVNENATYTVSILGSSSVEITATPRTKIDDMEILIEKDEEFGWVFTLDDGIQTVTNRPEE